MKLFDGLLGRQKKKKPDRQAAAEGGAVSSEAEPLPEDEAEPERQPPGESKTAAPVSPRAALVQLPPMGGTMLALWRLWRGEELPPLLTLSRNMDPDRLPLTEDALAIEASRLAELLKAAAESRWEELGGSEEDGPEPEAEQAAQCCCWMSADRMMAWCLVFPAVGEGKPLTEEEVHRVLEASGVCFGTVPEQVSGLISGGLELVPVALGVPPVPGSDGRVEEHFRREIDRTVLLREDGTVDYRVQNYVQNVRRGEVICDILPPVPGTAGRRVDGTAAEPDKVSPAALPRGRNVNISADGCQLVAGETGHVVYTESNFNVMKVLEIEGDVDYKNGNVDFPGDVHISGDVRDGFHIRAEGSILVDGLVEGARLDAGADILIARGVVGDGRALIRCRGDLHAKYLENCQAYAGRCIYAECTVASQLYSDDVVYVDAGRGSIIGGTLTVARGVQARSIGARSGRTTVLKLGVASFVRQEADELRDQLRTLAADRKRAAEDLLYLEGKAELQPGDGRLAKARVRCSALELKEQKLNKKLDRLTAHEPDLSQIFVTCETVYPITKIWMGDRSRSIDAVWEKFSAGYDMENCEMKIYTS